MSLELELQRPASARLTGAMFGQSHLKLESIHKGQSKPTIAFGSHSEFASSWMKQLAVVTHCGFVSYWRDPRVSLFDTAGLRFWQWNAHRISVFGATNSLQGFQDKLFLCVLSMFEYNCGESMTSLTFSKNFSFPFPRVAR